MKVNKPKLKALQRLYTAGMNRAAVAEQLNSPAQLIGLYERGKRFPGRDKFCQLVLLAESRQIVLLASDFIVKDCALGEDVFGQKPSEGG